MIVLLKSVPVFNFVHPIMAPNVLSRSLLAGSSDRLVRSVKSSFDLVLKSHFWSFLWRVMRNSPYLASNLYLEFLGGHRQYLLYGESLLIVPSESFVTDCGSNDYRGIGTFSSSSDCNNLDVGFHFSKLHRRK